MSESTEGVLPPKEVVSETKKVRPPYGTEWSLGTLAQAKQEVLDPYIDPERKLALEQGIHNNAVAAEASRLGGIWEMYMQGKEAYKRGDKQKVVEIKQWMKRNGVTDEDIANAANRVIDKVPAAEMVEGVRAAGAETQVPVIRVDVGSTLPPSAVNPESVRKPHREERARLVLPSEVPIGSTSPSRDSGLGKSGNTGISSEPVVTPPFQVRASLGKK